MGRLEEMRHLTQEILDSRQKRGEDCTSLKAGVAHFRHEFQVAHAQRSAQQHAFLAGEFARLRGSVGDFLFQERHTRAQRASQMRQGLARAHHELRGWCRRKLKEFRAQGATLRAENAAIRREWRRVG